MSCGHGPVRSPSTTRHSGNSSAVGGSASGIERASHHRRRCCRRRARRDRRHFAAVGIRRAQRAGHRGADPAHSARRITGALRGSRRRQPSSSDLSSLRARRRRRLFSRQGSLPHGPRRQRLSDRRGRGRILGTLPGLPGEVQSESDAWHSPINHPRESFGGQEAGHYGYATFSSTNSEKNRPEQVMASL
jgi:hypothetical protein